MYKTGALKEMKQNGEREYGVLDRFRMAAAFLVVAIHTSPLLSFRETGDFFLTRILARIAVPFFFMVSGFFVLKGEDAKRAVRKFMKKTALLYGISILLYIPLNIYNHYFQMEDFFKNLIKDIFFDGTFYHLWYLPAAIEGIAVAYFLLKSFGKKGALLFSVVLYLIGLFGDSYYGVIKGLPVLAGIYERLFSLSDYTRNGIFFAPVFFVLGSIWAEKLSGENGRRTISLIVPAGAMAECFLAMAAEGMLLHRFSMQRHDSMYVMLIPAMYFLFWFLTAFPGKGSFMLRKISMLIYIIHPYMIVITRMGAKVLHMEKWFIENSLLHYLAVSIESFLCALLLLELRKRWDNRNDRRKRKSGKGVQRYRPEMEGSQSMSGRQQTGVGRNTEHIWKATDRAWVEVNLSNLRHNARVLKAIMPEQCELMAVVKANAYGHGACLTAECLQKEGVRQFAVASLEEGIALRKHGITGEILILGYTDIRKSRQLKKYRLVQTVIDYEYAKELNACRLHLPVHIKIDTGMHRLGIDSRHVEQISGIFQLSFLKVTGIYSHLCVADSLDKEDIEYTENQIKRFYELLDVLKVKEHPGIKVHLQSSYGLLNYPSLPCDLARMGIALYGVKSALGDVTRQKPDLLPVLSLKARVGLIREIEAGESVSYGRAFRAERNSRIAILPIGYADGFPRNLSCGKGSVLIHGKKLPIVGRICMDQLAVDITGEEGIRPGDVAVLIGRDGALEISAEELAYQADTITNELLSRLGPRLKRVPVFSDL